MKNKLQSLLVLIALSAGVDCARAQTNWTQLSPSGGPPPARWGHTAVVNSANGRMIVFGGILGTAGTPPLANDVWIFQDARTNAGSTWQQLTISGTSPSARGLHSAVYDQANNRMMIFGGDPNVGNCFVDLNDVWVLTNADGTVGPAGWTHLSPGGTAPTVRSSASAVYNPASNRMIIYGGNEQCSGADADMFVLTNANGLGGTPGWTQLIVMGGPGARSAHAAGYDAPNNRMILFGGGTASGSTNDTYVLANADGTGGTPTWTRLSPSGPLPLPRTSFAAAYDPTLNTLVIFGGNTPVGTTNDVWVLSNANGLGGPPAWTELAPGGTPPGTRYDLAAVGVPGTGRFIICDGVIGSSLYNDVWALQYATPGPALGIASAGHQLVLYWPASATNYVLQTITNVTSTNWTTVTNGAPIIGVTLTNSQPGGFYRLQQGP